MNGYLKFSINIEIRIPVAHSDIFLLYADFKTKPTNSQYQNPDSNILFSSYLLLYYTTIPYSK